MKKQTASDLYQKAKDLEALATAKAREYAAAVLEGKPADDLLQAEVKLRNEAEAIRRVAIEAEKQEAAEREKQELEELRQALKLHESHKAKTLNEKAAGISLITEGINHLITALELAGAADNVRNQYTLAVPTLSNKVVTMYRGELVRLQISMKRAKANLTNEELQLLAALDKFL